jgi:archaellum component FlaC
LESKKPKNDIINTMNTYMQLYKNLGDSIIITRKNTTSMSADDIEKLKAMIIEIKTEKKQTSEWVKYFKDLNVIDD